MSHAAALLALLHTTQTLRELALEEQIQLSATHAIAALGADGVRSIPLSE